MTGQHCYRNQAGFSTEQASFFFPLMSPRDRTVIKFGGVKGPDKKKKILVFFFERAILQKCMCPFSCSVEKPADCFKSKEIEVEGTPKLRQC